MKLKFGGVILACVVVLWGALAVTPSVCAQEQGAHIRLSIEDGEYEGNHTDPWINESWVWAAEYKENGTIQFNLTVENRASESTDVYVLIAIRGNTTADDMQTIVVQGGASGTITYTLADFDQTDFNPFYLDQVSAGSHGVYPPSGNGIWVTYPVGWMEGRDSGNNVTTLTIEVTLGPNPSDIFVVHFDAYALDTDGELAFWSPNSHDATLMKEEEKGNGKGKGRGKKPKKSPGEDEEDPIEEPESPPIIEDPETPLPDEDDPPVEEVVEDPDVEEVVESPPAEEDVVDDPPAEEGETTDPVPPKQEPEPEVEIELPPDDDSMLPEQDESFDDLNEGGRVEPETTQGIENILIALIVIALAASMLSLAILRRRR
ncbi:MAG: hypothetical protein E3J35_05655 [Methanomassiliicoccales archaeon]|nr:MAG: hypothetical protein E3J35_05655 [Methanomassiliicoccales archaeon]